MICSQSLGQTVGRKQTIVIIYCVSAIFWRRFPPIYVERDSLFSVTKRGLQFLTLGLTMPLQDSGSTRNAQRQSEGKKVDSRTETWHGVDP